MQKFKVTIEADNVEHVRFAINEMSGVHRVSEPEMIEPEWKQKVREIVEAYQETTIDNEGRVHGGLCTQAIKTIIEEGGLLHIFPTGTICIVNWNRR